MAQSLEMLLIQFLMPDNDAWRQAEDQIKRLAKDPQVVPALVHYLHTAKTPNVRQLATVILRKKITGHWAKLSPQLRQVVKQSLIESITMKHRNAVDHVHIGADALQTAKSLQKKSRKCMMIAMILLLVIVAIIVLSIPKPWKGKSD